MARQQRNQANQTFNTATDNASTYGGDASAINGKLLPFEMQRLTTPEGYSQGDLGAMLANAFGSSGGADSGITGQANLEVGRTRNDAGFSTALSEAARARTAAAAHTSEGVAADNANLKQDQSSQAAKMLSGLHGTDVGAQNENLKTADQATQTGIEAGKSGWYQNLLAFQQMLAQSTASAAKAVGGG